MKNHPFSELALVDLVMMTAVGIPVEAIKLGQSQPSASSEALIS